jgi:hypothetical protein
MDARHAAARRKHDGSEDMRGAVRQMELFEALNHAQRPLAVEAFELLCDNI